MEKNKGYSHVIDLVQQYIKQGLSVAETRQAIEETLKLPWVKKMNVFSNQMVVLLENHSLKYLYVSPSAEQVLGYEATRFNEANDFMSLMTPEEFAICISMVEKNLKLYAELGLKSEDAINFRWTWNHWVRKKDGTMINLLQQNFIALLSAEGWPLLQMTIGTDITAFNNKREHFYNATMMNLDGSDQVLYAGKIEHDDDKLSPRERDVLKGIVEGKTSELIAEKLQISIETVKSYRKKLLAKTNSKDSLDLIRFGYANGWL